MRPSASRSFAQRDAQTDELSRSAGLPGGTRSGTIDPSLIFHHTPDCSETVQVSGRDITKGEYVLNKESGFQGASDSPARSPLLPVLSS